VLACSGQTAADHRRLRMRVSVSGGGIQDEGEHGGHYARQCTAGEPAALCHPFQRRNRRGCRGREMSDKTALSDVMVSLQLSPAPGARGAHEHLQGEYRRGAGECG
jgi:hypothetical protein